jgi:hypothetical protein
MGESGHERHAEAVSAPLHRQDRPYWRRAHRDWRFWVAAIFIFAAIGVYVWTVDLSVVPRG